VNASSRGRATKGRAEAEAARLSCALKRGPPRWGDSRMAKLGPLIAGAGDLVRTRPNSGFGRSEFRSTPPADRRVPDSHSSKTPACRQLHHARVAGKRSDLATEAAVRFRSVARFTVSRVEDVPTAAWPRALIEPNARERLIVEDSFQPARGAVPALVTWRGRARKHGLNGRG